MKNYGRFLITLSMIVFLTGCAFSNNFLNRSRESSKTQTVLSNDSANMQSEEHVHSFSTTWSYDSNNHWHQSSCEHDLIKDLSPHTFNSWHIVHEPTEFKVGSKQRECNCGYIDTQEIAILEHVHSFSTTWSYDSNNHWHDSNCSHKVTSNLASHVFEKWEVIKEPRFDIEGLKERKCSICGYLEKMNIEPNNVGNSYSNYKIIYELNGGTNNPSNPTTYTVEDEITLANPTKSCYEFLGWYDFNNNKVLTIEKGSVGNIRLSAQWGKATFDVIVEHNSFGEVLGVGEHLYQDEVELVAKPNIGRGFEGWYIDDQLVSTNEKYSFVLEGSIPNLRAVFTENDSNSVFFEFDSTSTTFTIHSISSKYTGIENLCIPDYTTSIDKGAFSGCFKINTIVIPFVGGNPTESDTSYFGYIFGADSYNNNSNCVPNSLERVVLSDMCSKIESYAFYGCSSLASITIPSSVTSIGWNSFTRCKTQMAINYHGSLNEWLSLSGKITLHNVHLFFNESQEETFSIVIPNNVTLIDDYAFYGCSSLTSITIPDSVASIGIYAFYGCSSLTSITIPDSVASIGIYAFYGCSSLTSVSIPNNVTSIGEYTFCDCSSLTSISIPDSVLSLGEGAFCDCSSLASISIPSNITSIDFATFYNCSSLTSISIPNNVTLIDDYAFYGCSSLTSITISDSVTTIGKYIFLDCESLETISYNGTIEQWKAVEKDSKWADGVQTSAIHCFDGDVLI